MRVVHIPDPMLHCSPITHHTSQALPGEAEECPGIMRLNMGGLIQVLDCLEWIYTEH